MPLTKQTMTVASRVMLPTYVVLFIGLGINYTFNADGLQNSPGLAFADDWPPHLMGYGAIFFGCGILVALALTTQNRNMCRFALILGQYCLYGWAFVFALAAVFGDASPTGCIIFWALGRACKASNLSLLAGER